MGFQARVVPFQLDPEDSRGTHTGATDATVLTDSTMALTVDDYIGRTIFNVTDGSSATVISNTATTITATLGGGTDNDWDNGDEWQFGFDVTSPGFGTPTAAMFVRSGSQNDSTTEVAHAFISLGIADGTSERVTQAFAQDAQGTTNTARVMRTDRLISESGAAVTLGSMQFKSIITDGIRVVTADDFTTKSTRGYAILMKGTVDVEVFQGVVDAANKDFVLSGAFKPDIVWFQTTSGATNGLSTNFAINMGCATRGGGDSITQWSVASVNADAQASVIMLQSITNSKVFEVLAGGGVDTSVALDEWRTDGFGLTRTGTAQNMDFQCLAIKLPAGQEVLCGSDTALTSTGNKSVTTNYSTGDDDSEIAVIVHCVDATAPDTFDNTDDADSISIGAADSTGSQAVCAWKDDDGNGTSQSKSAFLDSAVILTYDGAGAIEQQADMTNMLSPDLDINYSVVGANADNFFWWAIQKAAILARGVHMRSIPEPGQSIMDGRLS